MPDVVAQFGATFALATKPQSCLIEFQRERDAKFSRVLTYAVPKKINDLPHRVRICS
jgi:hypothetical protein